MSKKAKDGRDDFTVDDAVDVKQLLSTAHAHGSLSTRSFATLDVVDVGAQIQAGRASGRIRREGKFLADARVENPHFQRAVSISQTGSL